MIIYKEFRFEAAHHLPNLPPDHKCSRLHGHSFVAVVQVEGPVGNDSGWVMDSAEISDKFKPIYNRLDHYYLNEIEGLENPTSEVLAMWIWSRLKPDLPELMEQASAGQVLAYKFKGRRFDCGSVHGFVEATNYIYERMDRND